MRSRRNYRCSLECLSCVLLQALIAYCVLYSGCYWESGKGC